MNDRIGILGGAFDPPHYGHVLAAADVRRRLRLNRVLFVPTFCPPHRLAPVADYPHRVKMTRLATRGWPGLGVLAIEHRLPTPSYTVRTIAAVRQDMPRALLRLLLGADQYQDVGRWYRPELLTRDARIVVMSRPGTTRPSRFRLHDRRHVRFLQVVPVAIAASGVRRRLGLGRPTDYLLPPSVNDYIRRNRLYRPQKPRNHQEE